MILITVGWVETVVGVTTIYPDRIVRLIHSSLLSAQCRGSHIYKLSKDENTFAQRLLPHLLLISFVHISEKAPLVR